MFFHPLIKCFIFKKLLHLQNGCIIWTHLGVKKTEQLDSFYIQVRQDKTVKSEWFINFEMSTTKRN